MPKPLRWFSSSKSDIQSLKPDVQREIGFRLRKIQNGSDRADPQIKAFGEDDRIKHLIKITTDGSDGNTYRTAVAAEFEEGLWVLDVFEKRSVHGIATPKRDLDRIFGRLTALKAFRNSPNGKKAIAEMHQEKRAANQRIIRYMKERPK